MNLDLIRKLERIAHDKMWNADVSSEDFPNSFNVEFCELIVRECVRIAIENVGEAERVPIEKLYDHFGVNK